MEGVLCSDKDAEAGLEDALGGLLDGEFGPLKSEGARRAADDFKPVQLLLV